MSYWFDINSTKPNLSSPGCMQYVGVVNNTWKYVICRSKQHENRVSNIQMNCSQLQLFISFQFTLCFKTLPSRCRSVNRKVPV